MTLKGPFIGILRRKSMTLPKNFSREIHHCTSVHQFKLVHGYLRINARLISSERTVKYVLIAIKAWAAMHRPASGNPNT